MRGFIGLAHALISVKSLRIRNGDSPKNNQTKANTLVASRHDCRRICLCCGFDLVGRLRGSGKSGARNPQRNRACINTAGDVDALFLPLRQAHPVGRFRQLGWRGRPVFRLLPLQPGQRKHDAPLRVALGQSHPAHGRQPSAQANRGNGRSSPGQAVVPAVPRPKPRLQNPRPQLGHRLER